VRRDDVVGTRRLPSERGTRQMGPTATLATYMCVAGVIDAHTATYESAVKYMSRAGWRKLEPGDLGPPERPRLLRRAVQALEANDISMDSLADLAHIPVQEVHTYLTVPGSSARVSVEF
jgi:hypothetical protein